MGRWESTAKGVEFNPQYIDTAYKKDYWAQDPEQDRLLSRNLKTIAEKYGQVGNQNKAELTQSGMGTSGTIGQYSMGQKVAAPQAGERSDLYNKLYTQNATAEQDQMDRQDELNKMKLEAAIQRNTGNRAIKSERDATNRSNAKIGGGFGEAWNQIW